METRDTQEYGPVRIDPEMARQIKSAAALEGITMKAWLERAVKEYLERHPASSVNRP